MDRGGYRRPSAKCSSVTRFASDCGEKQDSSVSPQEAGARLARGENNQDPRLADRVTIGRSCHKYHSCHDRQRFCCDKHIACLSRQTFCCDKIRLVKINTCQQKFCHDKHNFVATNVLLRQAYFCCDKTCFIMTNTCLS